MDKSPDAFRTISEVADWLGTPTHVLRFWESRFAQVKPVKRAGGRRYYRPADMALLGGIKKLLHEDGLTIRGVQKILREEGVKHVAALSPPVEGHAAAEMAVDVQPAPEPDNVVQLTPAPAAEPAAGETGTPTEAEDTAAQAASDDTPEPAQQSAADTAADISEPAPGDDGTPAPVPPEAPEPDAESPPDAHIPAFLLTGSAETPAVPSIGETAPMTQDEAEFNFGPDDSGTAPPADADAPPPVAQTPEPEPEPDPGPSPAEIVLARLQAGASVDTAALRPLYDRLADLRQRMNASPRP